jgi:hypothetical protein
MRNRDNERLASKFLLWSPLRLSDLSFFDVRPNNASPAPTSLHELR